MNSTLEAVKATLHAFLRAGCVRPARQGACDEPPVYKQMSGIRQLVGMKVFQEFLAGQAQHITFLEPVRAPVKKKSAALRVILLERLEGPEIAWMYEP